MKVAGLSNPKRYPLCSRNIFAGWTGNQGNDGCTCCIRSTNE
jgi:hypothetical protein